MVVPLIAAKGQHVAAVPVVRAKVENQIGAALRVQVFDAVQTAIGHHRVEVGHDDLFRLELA